MNKQEQTLWTASRTGKYPRGTTAADLANVRNKNGSSALHEAALYKHLPDNTTIADLTNCRDPHGLSALHIAATTGCLPLNTTVADLANSKDITGHTALHRAAYNNHLPTGTTITDLANCKTSNGVSALHYAAQAGYLPADTTVADLTNYQTNYGATLWDMLILRFNDFPNNILNTPPNLFKDHHQLAMQWVNKTIEKNPDLKAKATLWLGKVLAKNQPTQHQTL